MQFTIIITIARARARDRILGLPPPTRDTETETDARHATLTPHQSFLAGHGFRGFDLFGFAVSIWTVAYDAYAAVAS